MSRDTIVERLLTLRDADPNRLYAIVLDRTGEQRLSYGALITEAGRTAHALADLGVGAGGRVLIVLDHSPACYIAFVGALLCGAVPAFLAPLTSKQDPTIYYDAVPKLIARLQAEALITSAERRYELAARVPDLPARVLEIEQRSGFAPVFPMGRGSEDVAFLQLSSGTTGLKKAVALPHRAVLAQVDAYAASLSLRPDDVIASWLPFYHDMGLIACLVLPLVTGVPVVSMDALQWVMRPAMLLRAIDRYRCTLAWLPNFAFHHLAAHAGTKRYDLSSLRAVVNCSEPCKAETFDLFLARFGAMGLRPEALQCCYAMAENVFAASQTALGRPVRVDRVRRDEFAALHRAAPAAVDDGTAQRLLSCGAALPGVRIRIVDSAGEPLPDRMIGEILVASDCLFDGYVNQPEATERALRDGWYRTGDLGYLAEGEVFVVGRKDDVIINNGRNYYAHEIERVVSLVEGVIPGRCVALGPYNSALGSHDIVVLAESNEVPETAQLRIAEGIRTAVAAEIGIAPHAVRICRPGELVKTTSGKISRTDNLRRYLERACGKEI